MIRTVRKTVNIKGSFGNVNTDTIFHSKIPSLYAGSFYAPCDCPGCSEYAAADPAANGFETPGRDDLTAAVFRSAAAAADRNTTVQIFLNLIQ